MLEPRDPLAAYDNPFFCPDPTRLKELEDYIWKLRSDGDSVGAKLTVIARAVPVGLGEPVFDRLDADLAKAMILATMAIAQRSPERAKGVEMKCAACDAVVDVGDDAANPHPCPARDRMLAKFAEQEARAQGDMAQQSAAPPRFRD